MTTIHPGAALFSEAARQQVAAGSLFTRLHGFPLARRNEQERCVLGALLAVDCPGRSRTPYPSQVLRALHAEDVDDAGLHLSDLIARNDRGDYADRANLRRDLLGEEVAR